MKKLIFQRLCYSVPVMFLVIAATFFMIHAAPGGPFSQERVVPPEVLKQLNAHYHLNDSLPRQFWDYLLSLIHGDFGPSFKYPTHTVNDLIAAGFPVTAELALYSISFALIFGLLAGMLAAVKQNTWLDYLPMSASMLGICLPSFVLGPILLLIFSVELEWFPVAGWGQVDGDKVLPSITLGACYAAYIARMTRAGFLEILSQDYIRTAKAKGMSSWRILFVHAFRGGISPVISFLGPAISGLLAGTFIVESMFQIPGLGKFYVNAAFNRDYTMIMGFTIFFAFLIIVFNLLSDLLLIALNPKLRDQASQGAV